MPPPIGDDELKLKQRARRRLIGAVALLAVLVLILPMVLDKEPRRATNDIVVHIPAKENVPLNPDLAPVEAEPKPEPAPLEPVVNTPGPAVPDDAEAPPLPPIGKPIKPIGERGFFVQVGVFSKVENAKSVQEKLAKNKLIAVTDRIKTSAGERTRVRLGPFASRNEADKVLSNVKRTGEKNAVIISVEPRR
jgi:DedD protein